MTVYFLKTDSEPPVFKVGYTGGSVRKRVKSIQGSCPYTLAVYATVEGGRDTEKEIQDAWEEYKLRGEWFAVPKLVVDDLLLKYGVGAGVSSYIEVETGSSIAVVRVEDSKVYVALSGEIPHPRFSRFQQIVYLATGDVLIDREGNAYVSLKDLVEDYPESRKELLEYRRICLCTASELFGCDLTPVEMCTIL